MDNKKDEVKEEPKEEVKEVKKGKGSGDKKPVIPWDKIDVTTATDDDIINSGLKHNAPTDFICYLVMVGIVVLMIIPPALRIIMPKPITEEEREITYTEMMCRRTLQRDGWELATELTSHYRETYVQDATFKFIYVRVAKDAPYEYTFAEIAAMNSLNYPDVKRTGDEGKLNVEIDFTKNYDTLVKDEVLKDYAYIPNAEKQFLSNQGFYCSVEVKTEVELVDVETGMQIVK